MSPALAAHVWPMTAGLGLLVATMTVASVVWTLRTRPSEQNRIDIAVTHTPATRADTVALPHVAKVPTPAPAAPARDQESAAPVPRNGEYALVFELDGRTYAAIDKLAIPEDAYPDRIETALPPHGPYRFIGDEYSADGAVAKLAAEHVPAAIEAWRHRALLVMDDDGVSCPATVSDIALVSLISGSFDYFMFMADEDMPPGAGRVADERLASVVASGTLYYAAELDGCQVERGLARLASLPAPVAARMHPRKRALVDRARAMLIASPAGERAQQAYRDAGHDGAFHADEYAEFQGQVFSHPRTGETTVSVHAVVDYGCGGADIDLWALYRVARSGELEPTRVLESHDIMTVGRPVDLDGDGAFEFPVDTYLGDRAIVSTDGTRLRTLEIPFYGCPC